MSLKIMIVDDKPANLQLLRSVALPLDHTVIAFGDTQEAAFQAAQRAEKQRFDVVFLGMQAPAFDGLELARRIRSSQINTQAAIIMLSASNDIKAVRTAFGEGADFVLPQPLNAARLTPMLAAMDSPGWKGKRHTARLPLFTDVLCTCDDRQFSLRSTNISESGMLLQPAPDLAVGDEVSLEFRIVELRASLQLQARVVRREGTDRMGVAFDHLAAEHLNAIQLYVMGRLRPEVHRREVSFSRPPTGS
jgi:CheY-like chemotaxis protein